MSEVNNTTNVKFKSELHIGDLAGENIAKLISKKLNTDEGIKSVTYVNGQLEIKSSYDQDYVMEKLKTMVFSSDEMQEFLDECVKSLSFKENNDETITLTTNNVPETKKITDFDIRELMKLLICAFSELRTADRERSLSILESTVTALESKIKAMEEAKDKQFASSMASAIGQIAGGALSIGMAVAGAGFSKAGPTSETIEGFDDMSKQNNITSQTITTTSGMLANLFNTASMPLGKIIEGTAGIASAAYGAQKAEADINVTRADALLEILRQANDAYKKADEEGSQIIEKLLNMMNQLIQSAAQTERSTAN